MSVTVNYHFNIKAHCQESRSLIGSLLRAAMLSHEGSVACIVRSTKATSVDYWLMVVWWHLRHRLLVYCTFVTPTENRYRQSRQQNSKVRGLGTLEVGYICTMRPFNTLEIFFLHG